jgi:large subunit ribosomal protein L4
MVVKVYGIDGSEQRDIDLADEVFNRSVSTGSIYHAIRNELANLRVGTASTKTRSEVRGSGTKPWRQKGTGRARAGTRQSPVWVGGGVVFGPKPRDYSYKIPKKLKRLAFKSIFSQKTQEERLMVVEDFTVESGKTRELVKILKGLTPENRTAIVISGEDSMLKRAGRNVPGLSILSYNRLRAHDLFYAGRVIVFEKAAEELGRMYGEPSSKRRAGKPPAVTKALGGAKPVTLEKPKAAGAGSKPAAKAKVTTDKPKAAAKPKTEAAAKAPTAKAPSKSVKTATAGSKPAAKSKTATAGSKAAAKKSTAAKTGEKPKATAQAKAATAGSKAAAKKPAAKKPDSRSTPSAPASPQKPAAPKKDAPEAGAPKAAPGGSKPAAKKSGTGKTSKEDA